MIECAIRLQVEGGGRNALREWLEYVAQTAVDWLDDLDAAGTDLEDDEVEGAA
jgi:hypothetical protein